MWHVYRAINLSKKEVYHGVSETPVERINRSHCAGGTKSIKHWVGLSGGAVLRMTVMSILKHLFFVVNFRGEIATEQQPPIRYRQV